MAKQKTPQEQKEKLLAQLKEVENKIESFNKARAQKIATMAKKFNLVDLPNEILEKEFKAIKSKYKDSQQNRMENLDKTKKKS